MTFPARKKIVDVAKTPYPKKLGVDIKVYLNTTEKKGSISIFATNTPFLSS